MVAQEAERHAIELKTQPYWVAKLRSKLGGQYAELKDNAIVRCWQAERRK